MAFDAFMEFTNSGPVGPGAPPKIVGESIDKSHPNTIVVSSFSFGIENPANIGSAAAGAGAGKAKFDVLELTKAVDSTSALLFGVAGAGQHFSDAALYVRKAAAPNDYIVYKFKLVFVNGIKWSGDNGDDHPQETITLAYGAMQMSYTAQTTAGAAAPKPVIGTWNQVANTTDFTIPGP